MVDGGGEADGGGDAIGDGEGPGDDPVAAAAASRAKALAVDFVPDEGADTGEYQPTQADLLLREVYGDHVHSNDGTHLAGGVGQDRAWQARWRPLAAAP